MINFCANLKVNNDIYKRLSSPEDKSKVQQTASEFEEFLNHPKIKAATEDDTIELRRGKYKGYSLELEITNPNLKEPYITGVYTTKKEPNIKSSELVFQTLLYLCFKKGEKPKFSETCFSFVDRVLFDGKLRNKNKEKSKETK